MGNRFKGGIAPGAMPPFIATSAIPCCRLGPFLSVGDRRLSLRPARLRTKHAHSLRTPGMEFASEMVVKAALHNCVSARCPPHCRLTVAAATTPAQLARWLATSAFPVLLSPRWLFLYPGIVLSLLGLASMAWLLPGPRAIGGVTLDINTLAFACAATICGVQSTVFSLFATVFAADVGLLPASKLARRFAGIATFEFGMVLGGVLLLLGLGTAGFAVGIWGRGSVRYARLPRCRCASCFLR